MIIRDFKLSPCCDCYILSFGWFPSVWILCAKVAEHTASSIFMGHVDKKNNWDEIARVYTASHVMWPRFILDKAIDLFKLESRNTIDTCI